MTKSLSSEDETYKYIAKKLKIRFHRRLGYDGEEMELINVELIPKDKAHRFMDVAYIVDGKFKHDVEFQSYPIYDPKMEDLYKYRIYSQCDEYLPFKSCVFATYPSTRGINELELDGDVNFHPDFFFTKNLKASEIINVVKNKNINNIALTDDEAIDLLIAPDMAHDYDIKELLKITSQLLHDAVILDEQFRLDLMDCQKKVLQRFITKNERMEFEKMLNLKAEDYGFEPNVTGFEEAVNLAYLDGEREGKRDGKRDGYDKAKLEDARNLLKFGIEDEIIANVTGLDLDEIQKLKE